MAIQLFLRFHKTVFYTDHTKILSSRLKLLTSVHTWCSIIKSLWSWLETVYLDLGLIIFCDVQTSGFWRAQVTVKKACY